MWGAIFSSSLIKDNNITCPLTLHEDAVFFIKACLNTDKIIVLDKYDGYIYMADNGDSATHIIDTTKPLMDYINGFQCFEDVLVEYNLPLTVFDGLIPMLFFMFFKFKGTKEEKITVLKKIYEFEISLNYPVKLSNVALNKLNSYILNKNYNKALFLSSIASKLYNQQKIKNFIFKRYSGLKKIEL